jgi:hypothetical protein
VSELLFKSFSWSAAIVEGRAAHTRADAAVALKTIPAAELLVLASVLTWAATLLESLSAAADFKRI